MENKPMCGMDEDRIGTDLLNQSENNMKSNNSSPEDTDSVDFELKVPNKRITRSKLREYLFLLLFRAEFNTIDEMKSQFDYFFEEEDIVIDEGLRSELENKLHIITEKKLELDRMINEKVVGWSTSRMNLVDLIIIRIGLYEMLWDDKVPQKVAINEAIVLSKKYGHGKSSGFVNGVLAKFMDKLC